MRHCVHGAGDHVNCPSVQTSRRLLGFRSGVPSTKICAEALTFIEFWLPVPPDSSLFVLPSHRLTSDVHATSETKFMVFRVCLELLRSVPSDRMHFKPLRAVKLFKKCFTV